MSYLLELMWWLGIPKPQVNFWTHCLTHGKHSGKPCYLLKKRSPLGSVEILSVVWQNKMETPSSEWTSPAQVVTEKGVLWFWELHKAIHGALDLVYPFCLSLFCKLSPESASSSCAPVLLILTLLCVRSQDLLFLSSKRILPSLSLHPSPCIFSFLSSVH